MMSKSKYVHTEIMHNLTSPEIIVPLVMELIKPNSVLDVGCGIGTWLHTFQKNGVHDIFGIDGDYVDKNLLSKYINLNNFKSLDLEKPFDLDRKFDLLINLEVAEHLKESSAKTFVESLCRHTDVILFSAAIPEQGGQNHINEQWPSYWQELFGQLDYVFLDIMRPLIWENHSVEFWYKQNMFLVVKSTHPLAQQHTPSATALVHPDLFHAVHRQLENKLTLKKITTKLLSFLK